MINNHRFTLEDYRRHGQTRFDCPRCNARKSFTRYIDAETDKHLGEFVGKCNRESKCQYHYTPRQFFADHPEIKQQMFPRQPDLNGNRPKRTKQTFAPPVVAVAKPFDAIPPDALKLSLRNYQDNGLARYLFSIIEAREVKTTLKRYCVGTWTNKDAVLWQIDSQYGVRTGKLIDYCPYTGKRRKSRFSAPNWVHSELSRQPEIGKSLSFATIKAQETFGTLSEDFTANLCFFGEHLLADNHSSPVAIVESEKTAVIASIFVPSYIWLAIGGKSYLKIDRLRKLAGRKIVLFPDADGFALWQQRAMEAARIGLDVTCSDLIETFATPEEKANGYDLADYLLSAKITEREQSNQIIDKILSDSDLFDAFAERMAILEFDGNLSPEEVERPEFVRAAAAHVYSENAARRGIQ